MITFDFETRAIAPPPNYPPEPVGLAIQYDDLPPIYLAWGHPTGNNCIFTAAKGMLAEAFASGHELLCHNARFDMEVAHVWFDLQWPDPDRVHDTMYLLFLDNPLAPSLSLKPSAERYLGVPPTEQDAVHEWLVRHGKVAANVKNWGGHICEAPGDLVGTYAAGDVSRTKALYDLLMPRIVEKDMLEAYRREQRLAPILNRSEREGLRVNLDLLKADLASYEEQYNHATREIKIKLHQDNEEFNLDSGPQLAEAIRANGLGVPDDEWPKTPTGRFSTSRDTLDKVITNQGVKELLTYRGVLKTLIGTFMKSWVAKAVPAPNGQGILHPSWNQVRGDTYGTRTGRLSSSEPNFQNIPTDFDDLPVPEGYAPYPHMRKYILPDPGEVIVSADFHSQEIRMLGHFAEGAIADIYTNDPSADIHQVAADIISDNTGLELKRKHTKIVAFSILYGAGVNTMADRMGVHPGDARRIKTIYLSTLIGVKEYMAEVESRAYRKQPVRTWGGRLLYAPEPVIQANGQVWNKDYVLINYHIQGSSADQTKQAIIDYDALRERGRFLATVHDEIVISVPLKHLRSEVTLLRRAMEAGEFCLPMRATVKYGNNWYQMENLE